MKTYITKFIFVAAFAILIASAGFMFTNTVDAAGTCGNCGGGTTDGGNDGGNDTPQTPTCTLELNKLEVTAIGESYRLTWSGGPASAQFYINGAAVADSGAANFTFTGPNYDRFKMVGNNGGVTCEKEVRIIKKVQEAPKCESFTASPATLPAGGGNVTLTWDTTNATNASIDNGVGTVAGDGSTVVNNVTSNRTFTLTLSNAVGSASCQASVTVTPPVVHAPICDFLNASPVTITRGQSSTLSWGTTNVTSASLNNGIGAVAVDGSYTVTPNDTTTYTLTAIGANNQQVTCSKTITVKPVEYVAPVCDFINASPVTITRGQSSTLSWGTTNATQVSINNGIGNVEADGTRTVSPLETTTYTLTATGAENKTVSCAKTIVVTQPEVKTPRCEYFNASATTIKRGNSVTLTWDTTNATAAVINPGVGTVAVDGSTTVSPSETTTYTLSLTGDNNQTTSCTRTVNVESGSNGGGGGSSSPKCTLKISDTKITRGDRITLKWDTSRATEVTLKDSHGKTLVTTDGKKSSDKKDLYDGEITLRPEKDTTYTLTAERGSKDRTCKVSVDVKDGVTVITDRDQKPVVTGISLTQVPYTGFEAGPFLTMLFYGLLLLWALYLAYVLVVRKNGGAGTLAMATPAPVAPVAPVVAANTISTPRFVAPVVEVAEVAATPVVGYAAATSTTDAAYEAVAEKVEDAAHAQHVLISSEAMRHFIGVTSEETRTETLTAVLAKAKASYPAEDGWVVLNIDRMKSVMAAMAPAVSVFAPRSVAA